MPTKPIRTWVLIADGARARVFETKGRGSGLRPIEDLTLEVESAPSRELVTDKPGRAFESVGTMRHAIEGPTDPHREQKRQFARRIADAVATRHLAKEFDRMVLVAPPVTMGDLRALLPDRVKAAISAEVVADLTNIPVKDLPAHLADHVTL